MSRRRHSTTWLPLIAALAGLAATATPAAAARAASAPAFSADLAGTAAGDDAVFGQDGIALGQGGAAPLFIAAP